MLRLNDSKWSKSNNNRADKCQTKIAYFQNALIPRLK